MKHVTKNTKLKPWTTLSKKIVHENGWYSVRHDEFVLPSGNIGNYYVLITGNTSVIIPIRNSKIIFVEQYRYPIKKWSLELPKGGIKKGQASVFVAKKELKEETGYVSKSMEVIGSFSTVPGVFSETCFVYIAKDLSFFGNELEDSEKEAGMKIVEVDMKEAYSMIDDGKIIDGQTIAAMSLARKYLLKNKIR